MTQWLDNFENTRNIERKQIKSTSPDHDLWNRMQETIENQKGQVAIYKVDSHQDLSIADDFQTWVFLGKNAADTLAKVAISHLPNRVVSSQRKASRAIQRAHVHNGILLDMYAKIGMYAVTNKAEDEPASIVRTPQLIHESRVISFKTIANAAANAPARLQAKGFHKILSWLQTLDDPNPNSKVYVITWHEMLWSFQAATSIRGFISAGCHGQWKIVDVRQEYDILKEAHAFANYIIALAKLAYPEFKPINAKPSNYRYQHWSMCIYARWNESNRAAVLAWLQGIIGSRQIKRIKKDLLDIPPPCIEVAPLMQKPSVGLHKFFT